MGDEDNAHTHLDAGVDRLVDVLREYGVLTGPRLFEISGAASWRDLAYAQVIARGHATQRIRPMDGDLYELGPAEREAS